MIKQLTTLYLTLAFLLSLGLTACGESNPNTDTEASTAEMGVPEAATEPAPFRMTASTPSDFKEATPDLENDVRPKRTSTGLVAIVGVSSGKLVQQYKGERRGKREIIFKDYGQFESISDSMQALNPLDAISFKRLRVSTPSTITEYDFAAQQGWRAPNDHSHYLNSGHADSLFLIEFIFQIVFEAERLPDTTINSYKTKVFRYETPNFIHTVWIWRGLIIREHFFGRMENVEYWVEPVSLETNIKIKDSEFKVPDSYVIVDRQGPPMPSALPPPQLGKPGEDAAQQSEPSDEFPIGE